jgi:hypothetical protein
VTELVEQAGKKLTEVEHLIAKARVVADPIAEQTETSQRAAIDQIMLRGAALTGCPLPSTEFFADIISQEIGVFLADFGYNMLTLEEVLLAMRLNCRTDLRFPSGTDVQQVPFVGNCFNVDFLSKVLANYSAMRTIFERKLENHIDGF